jgi:phosphoribosyl-ATP pyrophosphohydrolase
MKKFEELFVELQNRALNPSANSASSQFLAGGVHEIGKKLMEESGELWLALEHESKQRVAEEASQLIYFILLALVAREVSLDQLESEL